tara:strand:+ start:174391 stop:174651 length:261 start_codon:yes stop_codon:yes gene_type:complete
MVEFAKVFRFLAQAIRPRRKRRFDTESEADESRKSEKSGDDSCDQGRTRVPKNKKIAQDDAPLDDVSKPLKTKDSSSRRVPLALGV